MTVKMKNVPRPMHLPTKDRFMFPVLLRRKTSDKCINVASARFMPQHPLT